MCAILCYCRIITDRAVAFLGFGLHRDFITKGIGNHFVRAQVNDPLIAIHQNTIPVQRLGRDVFGADNQRYRQGPGHDGCVAAHRSLFQNDAL